MIYEIKGIDCNDDYIFTISADSDLEAYAKIFQQTLERGYRDYDGDGDSIFDIDDINFDDDDFDLEEYLEEVREKYSHGRIVNMKWFENQFEDSDVCSGTGFDIFSIENISRGDVLFKRHNIEDYDFDEDDEDDEDYDFDEDE